eukprot:scaffold11_cov257-Pinguiococcus_pyrenoidosus.AAC.59
MSASCLASPSTSSQSVAASKLRRKQLPPAASSPARLLLPIGPGEATGVSLLAGGRCRSKPAERVVAFHLPVNTRCNGLSLGFIAGGGVPLPALVQGICDPHEPLLASKVSEDERVRSSPTQQELDQRQIPALVGGGCRVDGAVQGGSSRTVAHVNPSVIVQQKAGHPLVAVLRGQVERKGLHFRSLTATCRCVARFWLGCSLKGSVHVRAPVEKEPC